MKRNILRERLDAGLPTLGTHVLSTWPGVVEVIGQTGAFHYIEYVGEYSPFSLEQMDHFGRTIELFQEMSSMMKVEEQTRGFIAARAIDSGIQNVLFTDCRTADDARECIRFIRPETPKSRGVHGYGMRRSTGYGYGTRAADWADGLDNTVIAIMIEKKEAIENLEEILAVEGVDMVQFGPMDYSISIGKPGAAQDPEVQQAHEYMIKKALEKGVHPRIELGSFEKAQRFLDMDVRHFCVGWDTNILADWCRAQREGFEKLLK